jgi:hypothetical protein
MRMPGPLVVVVPISLASVALWLTTAVAQAQELPGVASAAKVAVAPVQTTSKPVVNSVAPVAQRATTTATTAVSHVAPAAAPPPSSARPAEQHKSAPPAKRAAAPEPATQAATEIAQAVAPVTQLLQPELNQVVAAAAPEVDQVTDAVEPIVASAASKVPSLPPVVAPLEPIVDVEPVGIALDSVTVVPQAIAPADVAAQAPAAQAEAPDDDVPAIFDAEAPIGAVAMTVVNEVSRTADVAPAPAAAEPTPESLAVVSVIDDAQTPPSELDLILAAPVALADITLATTATSFEIHQIVVPSLIVAPALASVVTLEAATDIQVMGPLAHGHQPISPSAPPTPNEAPPSPAPASTFVSGAGSSGTAVPIAIALSLAAAWRALWLITRLLPIGITLPNLAPPG